MNIPQTLPLGRFACHSSGSLFLGAHFFWEGASLILANIIDVVLSLSSFCFRSQSRYMRLIDSEVIINVGIFIECLVSENAPVYFSSCRGPGSCPMFSDIIQDEQMEMLIDYRLSRANRGRVSGQLPGSGDCAPGDSGLSSCFSVPWCLP